MMFLRLLSDQQNDLIVLDRRTHILHVHWPMNSEQLIQELTMSFPLWSMLPPELQIRILTYTNLDTVQAICLTDWSAYHLVSDSAIWFQILARAGVPRYISRLGCDDRIKPIHWAHHHNRCATSHALAKGVMAHRADYDRQLAEGSMSPYDYTDWSTVHFWMGRLTDDAHRDCNGKFGVDHHFITYLPSWAYPQQLASAVRYLQRQSVKSLFEGFGLVSIYPLYATPEGERIHQGGKCEAPSTVQVCYELLLDEPDDRALVPDDYILISNSPPSYAFSFTLTLDQVQLLFGLI